jgi:hypothetical protein
LSTVFVLPLRAGSAKSALKLAMLFLASGS